MENLSRIRPESGSRWNWDGRGGKRGPERCEYRHPICINMKVVSGVSSPVLDRRLAAS